MEIRSKYSKTYHYTTERRLETETKMHYLIISES